MESGRHWVEDLFPPVYLIDPAGPDDTKDDTTSVYALAARRISRYDPETIRNVYERVWLLTAAQQQEEERREEQQAAKEKREAELAARAEAQKPQLSPEQKSTDRLTALLTGTIQGADRTLQDREKTIDSAPCLWTSDELAVLREVLTATRAENARLRAELGDAEQRVVDAERRGRKEVTVERDSALTEAKKANARLQLLIKHLKGEVQQAEAENLELRDDLQDLKEQKADVEKDLHEQRQAHDAERIRRENLEIDLGDAEQRAARALDNQEDRLNARHAYQVAALEKQLEEVRVELIKERKDHARTKKGLQHLQNHFSTVPVHHPKPPSGVVRKDELTEWSY